MSTTSRCRPGDLAIIVREEPGLEGNIGRIVEVHGPAMQTPDQGLTWLIVPVTNELYAVLIRSGKDYMRGITVKERIEHPDAWMTPIWPMAEEVHDLALQAKIDDWLTEVGAVTTLVRQ